MRPPGELKTVDPASLFVIGEVEGFTPEVARLVSMMHYARWTTLEAVRGLSVTEIDHLQDPQSNSIGALLLHVAAVEVSYQALTFLGRGLTGEELLQWEPALQLGELGRARIREQPIEYYLRVLALVRLDSRSFWLATIPLRAPTFDPRTRCAGSSSCTR